MTEAPEPVIWTGPRKVQEEFGNSGSGATEGEEGKPH